MIEYIPILIMLVIAFLIAFLMVVVGVVIRPNNPGVTKDSPYESGIPVKTPARTRINVQYYLVAIMFVLFEIETIFLIPWAINFNALGLFGLIEVFVFMGILLLGYFYAHRKGFFDWHK